MCANPATWHWYESILGLINYEVIPASTKDRDTNLVSHLAPLRPEGLVLKKGVGLLQQVAGDRPMKTRVAVRSRFAQCLPLPGPSPSTLPFPGPAINTALCDCFIN